MVLAVAVPALATPEALVLTVMVLVLLLNVADAPEAGAVNATFTFGTGLPKASVTVTESAVPNAVFTVVDWGETPVLAAIVAGAPGVLVSEKFAGVATVGIVAATLYGPPAVVFAVKVLEVARPEASETAVLAVAKLPLAPLPGAAKVTVAPGRFAVPSFTMATSGFVKAVFTTALCPEPLLSAML